MWSGPVFPKYRVVLLFLGCGGSLFGSLSLLGTLLLSAFLGSLSCCESGLVSSLLSLASCLLGGELLGVLGDYLKGDLNSDLLVQTYDTDVLARGLYGLMNAHDLAVNIVTGSEQRLMYLLCAN